MTDTPAAQEGERWGRKAAQRAELGAKMSMPAWKTAIERTGITAGTKVLDLACGSGEFCAAATEAGAKATGIDISPAMIALARQASTAEFHELPLGRLPWQDGTFDVVTAFNALFFAQDPDEAFAEAVRVSKDYVVVCQWHPEHPSDLLVVGRAVRGTSGRRGARLPEPQEKLTIDIPLVHPDEATMLRGFLSVGSYQRIIESEGEEKVAEKIKAAVEPFRTPDGGYRFSNKYLMSIFRKSQAASIS
jgi:SAM-dependent methyltransferase